MAAGSWSTRTHDVALVLFYSSHFPNVPVSASRRGRGWRAGGHSNSNLVNTGCVPEPWKTSLFCDLRLQNSNKPLQFDDKLRSFPILLQILDICNAEEDRLSDARVSPMCVRRPVRALRCAPAHTPVSQQWWWSLSWINCFYCLFLFVVNSWQILDGDVQNWKKEKKIVTQRWQGEVLRYWCQF